MRVHHQSSPLPWSHRGSWRNPNWPSQDWSCTKLFNTQQHLRTQDLSEISNILSKVYQKLLSSNRTLVGFWGKIRQQNGSTSSKRHLIQSRNIWQIYQFWLNQIGLRNSSFRQILVALDLELSFVRRLETRSMSSAMPAEAPKVQRSITVPQTWNAWQ